MTGGFYGEYKKLKFSNLLIAIYKELSFTLFVIPELVVEVIGELLHNFWDLVVISRFLCKTWGLFFSWTNSEDYYFPLIIKFRTKIFKRNTIGII